MKCVILAAGEGKRMHPLTFTRPKVMLPIANKPILEWNVVNAIQAGITEFVFVIGYKSEMVRNYFGDGNKWNVSIEYVNQGEALGTAHAIGMVEQFVDDCIVVCGDTIFGVCDIKKIVEEPVSIGLVEVENPEEYGVVKIKEGNIIAIYEKMNQPISKLINAGIYHFTKDIFSYIKKTEKSPRGEYEITDAINLLLTQKKMKGIFLQEWRDVVYPWHLLDANEEKLQKIERKITADLEENTTIKGNVVIGKDTIIRAGSYIEGPTIIGNNCNIGPNCYIRAHTAIGDNCHIGHASEVKNSIVMDNSNVPHQNYVGDSIMGSNCNLGAGTKIANLRLDKKNITVILNGRKIDTKRRKFGAALGDNVQTGINATINIGTTIGNNCFIAQGSAVSGELSPNSKIL